MYEGEATRLDDVLRAMADPTRRRIIRVVAAHPGMTTTELASRTRGMTRWGVMKHLGVLRAAGLVQSLDEGRHRRHYHDGAPLELVRRWLDEESGAGSA